MQKTQLLIQSLVNDLPRRSDSANWSLRFWRNWFVGFILTGGLAVLASILLPNHLKLPENLYNWNFLSQLVFWFLLSLASAAFTFFSSIPNEKTKVYKIFVFSIFLVFIGFILSQTHLSSLSQEFFHELDWRQGPCGVFIFLLSALWTSSLFGTIKKAAPTNLIQTGVALTLSTASATSMFIHMFCRHETSSHVFLWHFLPLLFIVGIVGKTSSRFLRW
jgi:hypothetical protein